MKKLAIFLSMFLPVIVLINSCSQCCSGKKIDCLGYTDANGKAWIPYSGSGRLIFKNNIGINDTLTFDSTSLTAPYSTQRSCDGCDATKQVFGNGIKSINFYHQMPTQTTSGADFPGTLQMRIFNNFIYADSISATGFVNVKCNSCNVKTIFLPQLLLNGISFAEVQQIDNDTSANCNTGAFPIFKHIWLAKNRGLIGYETIADNKLWALQ